ncbi:helicase-related protein [Emticicia sp. BO119]|uniref:helicase-related protein n=1 Tax=Emticicia sp. BO119 TaxID=2757768 RepID=UPI0015F0717F|nr:helicase-related protein [Emticicia sp. BO119]MBA4852003.1 helicase [Emticicia sp. BO119]
MQSTKFFTNDTQNTLLQKIEGIFNHRNIHFFDALVGYFRATGYFRIRPFIEKAKEIRILVGINVDKLIYEAQKQGILFEVDVLKSQEDFVKSLKENIQKAAYKKEIEDGMLQLIEDLLTGKVQIKVHPKQNIHAKIYIFREQTKHSHGYGAVITGSSNLTEAGLERNFEFNVELREDADIDFATDTFEKLWTEGIAISEEFIETIKKETYLNNSFTPFEVYIKFLIEYYGKSVDFDPSSVTDLPKGFKRLSYQVDAVNDGYNKMMKHGGFFLSDVVGLGKTIVATLIAKKFFYFNGFPSYVSRTLIIVPPALKSNWEETLEKFQFINYDIITNGSLHRVINLEKYDLVIVDEAHKFRSDAAEMYNYLQKICKSPTRKTNPDGNLMSKKVILVSATPLNNRPEDIANLVYLFQDSKDSSLEVSNLQNFFRRKIDEYRKLKLETDIKKVQQSVKQLYEEIREKVIKPLMVRRTRTDLNIHDQYSKDLIEQGIKFPDIQKPEKIFYQLHPRLEELYDYTITCLSGLKFEIEPIDGSESFMETPPPPKILTVTSPNALTYSRYRAISFLKPHKKAKYKKADIISGQLAMIMKTLLVKRIDSSFFAFKQSIKRFLEANVAMIKMFEKGKIFIAPNLPINDYINSDREDELLELILEKQIEDPSIEICEPDDFEKNFIDSLKHDTQILTELNERWKAVEEDPKLDVFLDYIQNRLFDSLVNPENKLVVFSESKETTKYLEENLKNRTQHRILSVDSASRTDKMPTIRANFDANFTNRKEDFDIVISTEVLAEGVNLHRSNIIVNYDTPWNSTRLMQRIGRVNRIGSRAEKVYVFNFFPTAKVDRDIDLQKKAIMKLQAFHAALGEDSQIYSPDEEIETFGLFDKDPDEERDESLVFLMFLRKFREENLEDFKRIKNMPLRARVGRKDKTRKESTITFIRTQKRDAFYYIKSDNSFEELTFLETAKVFKCELNERSIPLHNLHHEQIEKVVAVFAHKINEEKAKDKKVSITAGPNEKKALEFLEGFLSLPFISNEEKELINLAKKAISKGRFQNLQRDINKLKKNISSIKLKPAIILEKLIVILKSYPLKQEALETVQLETELISIPTNQEPEIIISESFNII